jgi:hypothetical protein
MNMKKGQTIRVINEQLKAEMLFGELLFGSGKAPSFEGELVAVYPTPEEFAKHNENFKACYEAGEAQDVHEGVIYWDTGAGRAFWVKPKYLEVVTVN